jgi:hypothetical protein
MKTLERLRESYSNNRLRFYVYVVLVVSFISFFAVILSNPNSRYNMRLQQTETRISTRMQTMREGYLKRDSIFRAESDSIRKLDSLPVNSRGEKQ